MLKFLWGLFCFFSSLSLSPLLTTHPSHKHHERHPFQDLELTADETASLSSASASQDSSTANFLTACCTDGSASKLVLVVNGPERKATTAAKSAKAAAPSAAATPEGASASHQEELDLLLKYLGMGEDALKAGQYARAIEVYSKLQGVVPGEVNSAQGLALAYLKAERYVQSVKAYEHYLGYALGCCNALCAEDITPPHTHTHTHTHTQARKRRQGHRRPRRHRP